MDFLAAQDKIMDFWAALEKCSAKIFDFSGRAQRSEFWYWILFLLIMWVVFSAIRPSDPALIPVAKMAIFLALSSAVTARRLHDTGHSGWWQLASLGILVSLASMGFIGGNEQYAVFIILVVPFSVVMLVVWPFMVFWLIKTGVIGENKFGPAPNITSD